MWDAQSEWIEKRLWTIVKHYGLEFFAGAKVLDLGCGHGEFGIGLSYLGADVTFCDARQEHLDKIKERLPDAKMLCLDLNSEWPDGQWDLIIHFGVLYHLNADDVAESLKKACISSRFMVLETEVCDSQKPYLVRTKKEDKEDYSQALHGRGCKPSLGFIERIMTECDVEFKLLNTKECDSRIHHYTWIAKNKGRAKPGMRRMWFVKRKETLMKIGIVGVGMVGGAVKYGMEKLGHDVKVHDIALETHLVDVLDTELCFVCVPTPEAKDGSCDTSIVEGVVFNLLGLGYSGIIVIKSTAIPGFTSKMSLAQGTDMICFVPEFLRERHAISDFTEHHDICVIGVEGSFADHIFDVVSRAHGHYPKKFVKMSPTEAELTKYFSNVFNAMRVIFANGFYEVCEALGADYSKIKSAAVERPTMTNLYLDCNENFRGFGGVCLPKDTAAFSKLAEELGIDAQIFRTIVEDNSLYKTTVFDHMRLK